MCNAPDGEQGATHPEGASHQGAAPDQEAVSTTPPASVTDVPETALPQLIAAERDASRRGDLALLAQLWASGSRIVDSRGTTTPADDYIWDGRAAILDRYQIAVFPVPPPAFESPPDPTLTVEGETARGQLGNDRWTFIFADGRWWLQELAY
jgi:hypothetical protein